MNELQEKLIKELSNLIAHLNTYEEQNWASIFFRIQKLVDNGDRRGIDLLKNVRGGMASFTDLIISQNNGHKVEKSQEDHANNELTRIGNLVFTTADKLDRELNRKSA